MDLSADGKEIEKIIVSQEQIQTRLKELAAQIVKDYEGRDLILIGVLGREVLIVEDILDTGLTLSWLTENLLSRGAKSVSVFTVLRKPDAATVKVEAKYVGFDIPSEFVVGYGLDFNQKYRNLPFIGVLAKHLYS